ncbi:Pr6Pr family membrane protein [Streptomyces sp. NPDC006624]|uniref:Pr6Pr family membrane protein n=1 Tax=Streptomyces sp. NPDC006624 TaxID=3154892 RepID=UPI0033B831B3
MTAPIPRDIPDLPAIPRKQALRPSPVPATAVVAPVRRPAAAAYRLLIALAAAGGVTLELLLGDPARALSLFAIQSNILLALVMAFSARRAWTARRPIPGSVMGATLLYVLMTTLVHHLLPANGAAPPSGWQDLAHHTLYTVTPIAAVLDWLLLTAPGRLHLRNAPAWLLYPLAYLAFSLIRGELLLPGTPDRYLYPFLDVGQDGYKRVFGNALLLGLSCYALALLLVALDHTRPNPIRHRGKTGFRL